MQIGNRKIHRGGPPYVIAEIGVNHDGSRARAVQLVQAAASAGAAAVKLQLFQAARLISQTGKLADYQARSGALDPFDMLQRLELSVDEMQAAVNEAHVLGLHAIVTVFSVELVDDAARLPWDCYKTASPDIINSPLIERLLQTEQPLILSTGAATLEEVEEAARWVAGHPHMFMQCVSAYPTDDRDAALGGRAELMTIDPAALGYSDHTASVDTGALAVASGACVLEKHITHDRGAAGPDHAASLDPAQFAEYVRLAHRAWQMLGPACKRVLPVEREVRELSRQSITTARPLQRGQMITRDDLTIKRPGTGLAPTMLETLIGRRVAVDVESDVPMLAEHLAPIEGASKGRLSALAQARV